MKRLNEYLIENLKTHDYTKLCELIYKEYADDIVGFNDYINKNIDKKSIRIVLKTDAKILNYNNLINKNECLEPFYRLIEFYNYGYKVIKDKVIDKSQDSDNQNKFKTIIILTLDPIYPIEVSNIFAKYDRQAYHFTTDKYKENILKSGLRTKENRKFNNIPKRIYLYMSNELINTEQLNNYSLKVGVIKKEEEKYIAFKVDMSTLNYKVYQDTRVDNDRAIFIYNNIPPKFLMLVE